MGIRALINRIRNRKPRIREYLPTRFVDPPQSLDVVSAWKGLDRMILDIIERFDVGRERCIEFGVEFGYSTVTFSGYFNEVVGVDTFVGDIHTRNKSDHFEATKARLAAYRNIRLVRADFRDHIRTDSSRYDMAHVDIVHTYEETYDCGLWAAQHSDVVLFHDTESFPDVRRAVMHVARDTGGQLYNYPKHHGLGILVLK